MSTHLEAVQWEADPCHQARGPDLASGAGFSASLLVLSESYRSSLLAGDSTQPVKQEGNKVRKIWRDSKHL